jgi:hypothetical protein
MQKKWITIIAVILSLIILTAATGKSETTIGWGKIKTDEAVKKSFEKYEVKSSVNYYISGPDNYPTAILGLDKSYTLDTNLWKKVELTPELLRSLVSNMQKSAGDYDQSQFGFLVLDNNGKQIGVWYSLITANTFVKIKEDKKVVIWQPFGSLL